MYEKQRMKTIYREIDACEMGEAGEGNASVISLLLRVPINFVYLILAKLGSWV